jgi:mannan endo-1,4-beta-mannosidase
MRTRIALAGATLAALLVSLIVYIQPAHAATGIRVSNGRLVEANGTELVLRGINHAHTWYTSQTSSFANIKATGANSVRVVLSGGRWQPANGAGDVTNVINLCKQNRLICVLENHDTTGFGEQGGAVSLDAAVNYWISVQSALTGQENYVILNIGNEPIGNNAVTPGWTQATISAIQRLRNAGFQHTIMVDAPNWGQDWQFTMRDNAPAVLAADTTGNTIFDVHMYGVYNTAQEITDYLSSFLNRNLAICVCEFGFNHSDGDPDEDTIMSFTQANRIGYMGWSWSGNSGGVEYLDMVTSFNPAQRTSWGTRIITGANGISSTSREATIFGGGTGSSGPPDTQAPTTPGTPTASNITSSSVTLNWSPSTDNRGVARYEILRAPGSTGGTFTQIGTSTTTTFTDTGLTAGTTYRYQVRARDAANNASGVSGSVTVTTSTGGGGGCTAAYRVVGQWPGGFQGEVTVTNGATASTSWTVTWTFANGQTISQIWGAQDTPNGASHSARNMPYNGSLGPSQSTTFGFIGSWNGTNSVPPVSCSRA